MLNFMRAVGVAASVAMAGLAGISMGAPTLLAGQAREPGVYADGFNWVFWQSPTDAEIDSMLERIALSGARHLQIPYFGCQTQKDSSDVGGCPPRTNVDPVHLARKAIEKGFTASFLPIIVTPQWDWRGTFEPRDVPAWFRSYTEWITRVARQAKELGMTELVVGTEFNRLYRYESEWKTLLHSLRSEFSGALILTVNWDDLNHGFWSATDAIGVSAYPPLTWQPNPSQQELDASWKALHDDWMKIANRWKRPLHLTEVGYQSVSSAAATPWTAAPSAVPDSALQARCFEAFRKAWAGEKGLSRALVWATSAEDPLSIPFATSFEPLGKPAESVIAEFFSLRSRIR